MPKISKKKTTTSASTKPKTRGTGEPVWKGPEVDGITFSLLSRYLVCKERFRLLVMEGLRTNEGFNHRIEYGNLWHLCEEAVSYDPAPEHWRNRLVIHCRLLCQRYPLDQEQIEHWYKVCLAQFPVYLAYWDKMSPKHPLPQMQSIYEEECFNIMYELPSGAKVRLRGKWDRVYRWGGGIWLQENKTKGDVNEGVIRRQLTFDLQTMLYLAALRRHAKVHKKDNVLKMNPVVGVRYNVVRRPLAGGKGSIVRHKPSKSNPLGETADEYYGRLRGVFEEDPAYFFMRWDSAILDSDIDVFERTCLVPILESLHQWWTYVSGNAGYDLFQASPGVHWRHPFGVWNVLDEGGSSDVDEYLATGSEVGLERTTNLFPELT